ncbi:MAG: chemotaxis protein CheW [Burkholderiaceae bacterium]
MAHDNSDGASDPSGSSVNTDTFIPFMRDVVRCESALRELNLMWRLIEASAKMNCPEEAHSILPMMAATRAGFQRLEGDLVHSLVQESLGEVMAEIGTHAHHVIDIVVRNLYERTADVGFLATDQDLCRFVAGITTDPGPVLQRLREYRNKYTVYDEIMLLDREGAVLAQIDEDAPVEGSHDPLIAQTLASAGHVETFRATPLRPGKEHALIYSQRMLDPRTGQPAGVLCLSFAFHSEMEGIFHARQGRNQRNIALLLDADDRVIASSDALWIPVGAQVPVNLGGAPQLLVHGGRTYLVRTVAAQGYQGYPGPPGWKGQVMVPVELAFSAKLQRTIDALDPAIAQGLLAHAKTFCPPLYEIVTAADTIRRVVWNGQVMTAGKQGAAQKLKAVLEQIGETGARTNEVFTQSIRDLYDTVLSSRMRDSMFLTQLLVDLLDRNLYERANDCRWWALTPELRALLADAAQGKLRAEDVTTACRILEHINSLYTVYTRLVVYDRTGRIVAASRPTCKDGSSVLGACRTLDVDSENAPQRGQFLPDSPPHSGTMGQEAGKKWAAAAHSQPTTPKSDRLLDTRIDPATLAAVLTLPDTQSYHVSPWQASPLDEGRLTYVYHAAIRAPGAASEVVGGIGIVFNSSVEFDAMLRGATASKPNTHTVFVHRTGHVIASTDPARPPGHTIALPADLLALPNGHSTSRAMVHDGHYCIVGCSASHGYREFKISDGYRDDVLALSFESLGAVQAGALDAVQRRRTVLTADMGQAEVQEMATFFIDAGLFAFKAEEVLEALPASAIAAVSAGRMPYCVGTLARKAHGSVTGYVWVFDLGQLLRGAPSEITPDSQVIVLEHAGRRVGLLVNELHGVTAFARSRIFDAPNVLGNQAQLVTALIQPDPAPGEPPLLVQCLDAGRLLQALRNSTLSAVQDAAAAPLPAIENAPPAAQAVVQLRAA